MELHQIRYAIALCEEHSFTQAAQRCGVTQPTVTNAIKKLEQELGQRLFDRRRTELTPFGSQVLPVFHSIQEACTAIHMMAAEHIKRVGAHTTNHR